MSDTAAQRALHDEALLFKIVEWLTMDDKQDPPEWHYYSPSTKHQLLAVALTCKAWFHPGISWLWRRLDDLNMLAKLLLPENLRGAPEDAQYKYAKETYYADPALGCLHPQLLIFRYYAGLIHALRVTGMDFDTPIFSMLGSLHDADVLFPSLQSVSWSDGMGDITPRAIRTFGLICRAPLLTALAISVYNPSQDKTSKGLRTLQRLYILLNRAANYAPGLKALTIVGPTGVKMSVLVLSRFCMLDHVNIQVSIEVPISPSPPVINANADDHRLLPQTLFLTWMVGSDILSILHVYQLSNLTSLTLMADDHPPNTFLEQVHLFGWYTSPCLKSLRIEAGIQIPLAQRGLDFEILIQPFLLCSALEDVSILLPSFRIRFQAADFQEMLTAWPNLRSLDISFMTSRINQLPDLCSVIQDSSRRCPNLTQLRLPAIATYKHINRSFSLRPAPASSPYKLHFSSDVLILNHHPLDVAYWISKRFKYYNPIRSDYIIGGSWSPIDELVRAIKMKDTTGVLKCLMASWRINQWGYTEA